MRELYLIRRAVMHGIDGLCQAMAGSVNQDKLTMLVEKTGSHSWRCGNFEITQLREGFEQHDTRPAY